MGLVLRPSAARGHAELDWLDSRHSFSFAHYYDPSHMGFRSLRVINDDVVRRASGFPMHGHSDMEIFTYVVRGSLAHRDTTGGTGVLSRGDVQAMTAGTGVRHSEYNTSPVEDLRLLQIWLVPDRAGYAPAYRDAHFDDAAKRNVLRLVAAPRETEGALHINQDARIHASLLEAGKVVSHRLGDGRGAWIQVVDGDLLVNGQALTGGDGAAIEEVADIEIQAKTDAEFLLFDLA
jgi:redox-sensitive bicupin YhaK (pirin superfamily)